MGRASRATMLSSRVSTLSDEVRPAKRPASWGAELPEDPIFCSQVTTPVPAAQPGGARPAGSRRVSQRKVRPSTCGGDVSNSSPKGNAEGPIGKQLEQPKGRYNILAALGVKLPERQPDRTGRADAPKQTWLWQKPPQQQHQEEQQFKLPNQQQKQLQIQVQQQQKNDPQKNHKLQLFKHEARDSKRKSKKQKEKLQVPEQLSLASNVVEGVVERRVDNDAHQDSSGSGSFQVWLRTPARVLQVHFTGSAARAFSSSLGLCEGGRVRFEGFKTAPESPENVKELHFHDVRQGVRVSVLEAPSKSGHIKELQDLKQAAQGQAPVDVEAAVEAVGELEHCELALEPGEFVSTRSLWLRCAGADQVCRWRLWASQAERHGHDLMGQRILIRGTRVHEVKGLCELTGSAKVERLALQCIQV